ncbi:hypothetical protein HZB69_03675 [Candidatus Amesbacteria bacterium]|nr:hypothetical protein [Candidatus Amesbacteria bacterium]
MITHLHILQLEEYDPIRFLRWWVKNIFVTKLQNKKPLVWTPKTKFIYCLSFGFWPLMFLALLFLKPYEIVNRITTKNNMRKKILKLKQSGLKVIAISGSYGKTSVKEYLYQILKTKYKVLRTPGNFNTLFGIAKVVEWELDESYDYFIVEMGSYKIGETAELCETYLPDYAMLTGINEQHLERFGSLENEIKGESESVEYVLSSEGKAVINIGNPNISKKYLSNLRIVGYGTGTYTHPREQNLEGAMVMAKILGVHKLPKELKNPIHRLSLLSRGDMTIIDDAYSSNTDGFAAAVKYLKSFKTWKVIVTPGIPELGSETYAIHKKLGALLNDIDQVILVGKNDRTRGLADGYGKEVSYIDKVTDAIGAVEKKNAVVLFENDLPDNY